MLGLRVVSSERGWRWRWARDGRWTEDFDRDDPVANDVEGVAVAEGDRPSAAVPEPELGLTVEFRALDDEVERASLTLRCESGVPVRVVKM